MTKLYNLSHKKDERRTLRSNLTPAEAKLWSVLKSSQLHNRKFRRQYSIGEFIVDFYCPEEKLAVELDGAGHFTVSGNLHDAARTAFFEYCRYSGATLREQSNLVRFGRCAAFYCKSF